jgi:hypothetical protein
VRQRWRTINLARSVRIVTIVRVPIALARARGSIFIAAALSSSGAVYRRPQQSLRQRSCKLLELPAVYQAGP